MELSLVGIPASPGIVIGPVHLLHWEVPSVPRRIIPDEQIASELERFRLSLGRAAERLRLVRKRAEERAGAEEAAIFDVQLAILDDSELVTQVETLIRRSFAAETAVDLTMLEWREHFSTHKMPMMRERVSDLIDVQIRVLSILLGLPDHDPVELPPGTNAILVTHDLTPSLTIQLDRKAIAAIATDAGTRISHVAILARSLGLPAVVGLRDATKQLSGGERAILDGAAGRLIVSPTDAEVEAFLERARRTAVMEAELDSASGGDSVTLDGVRLTLRVNVDLPEEAELAARSGAEGVGLMRTEFLVVGRAAMPDEEEQYRAYRRVVESFPGMPVVIRTYDLGGDKLPVGGFPQEANPFLGWRAIRLCLDQPEFFRTQLRALLRAAMHGDVRIMLPLVVTVDEVRQARALLEEAGRELAAAGVAHRTDVPLGVMVETPAAAVGADSLVDDVAFFSIGTNDLVQYTLAVDRGNANLAARFTPMHPSVLRLIKRTVDVGDGAGLEVCVCGEMASQPLMALVLIGLGVRQLSISPRAVSLVKRLVRAIRVDVATDAATQAMASGSARAAEAIIQRCLSEVRAADPILSGGLPDPD
ncbi:MAG: phosphoenolpyruvate--protein phosphotransferase [Gemmatimonadota bacterium]|nr:phosphoenolpyruvate--protein phosphotransferase [Gemmatimonadota bacterium]